MPLPSTILMIRPAAFGFNAETATSNFFQSNPSVSKKEIQKKALAEFDNMIETLQKHHINVLVIEDTQEPPKPDAIFPNNWLSTSPDGLVSVFPMFAPNRRAEKREDILKRLAEKFVVKNLQDWSEYEAESRYLEGTGSMIIDHENKLIYACVSERTNISVLEKYAATNNFQAIVFVATDNNGYPVYHTNVVMSLGDKFCVLCEEAIDEEWELIAVRQLLESTGHDIIPITKNQMHKFAGNMLQVKNTKEENILILSQTAFESLRKEQKQMLEAYSTLLPVAVPTIEEVEGGSVRCMMAEIFLGPKK
jgi:hypothetical protein